MFTIFFTIRISTTKKYSIQDSLVCYKRFLCGQIPDGANTVIIGRFGSADSAALVGGNCAIHGFDRDGNDTYWMVTGDNITAMALVDIDGDKQKEVCVVSCAMLASSIVSQT